MKIVALFPEYSKENSENQLLDDKTALNLPKFLENTNHELIIVNNNEEIDQYVEEMEVVISSPFYPAYITKERVEKAKNLKLAITAGVGSDHVDLEAAEEHNITVLEVTGCNTVSVAEHTVMDILILLHNYEEGHRQAVEGEWNLAKVGNDAYELQNKTVGIFGYGQIGELVAKRLKPFDVNVQHFRRSSKEDTEYSKYAEFDDLLATSDVVVILSPLTDQTDNLFDKENLNKMKDGSYLVNTARGKIVNKDELVKLVENKKIQGYGGDVWYPQPAPSDHPWRTMPRNAMTIHYSGMTIESQQRIEKGVKGFLSNYFNNEKFDDDYVIVDAGNITNSSYK